MHKWIKEFKLQGGDSFQVQLKRQKSKKQYMNYHQKNKYQQHRSPHLLMMQSNHKHKGLSPHSNSKIGQILSPISAQKSLIIKNMHLQSSASRQLLPKVLCHPQKHQSTYITNKLEQNRSEKHPLEPTKSKLFGKDKHNSRFRIKQSYRMKTQEINIKIEQKGQGQSHINQTKLKKMKNSKGQIQKISREISKSFVLNDLGPSHQAQKFQNNIQSDIHIKQSLLLQNQSDYLKINKLSPKNERTKLYFTQNGKDYLEQFDAQTHKQEIKKVSVIEK